MKSINGSRQVLVASVLVLAAALILVTGALARSEAGAFNLEADLADCEELRWAEGHYIEKLEGELQICSEELSKAEARNLDWQALTYGLMMQPLYAYPLDDTPPGGRPEAWQWARGE